MRPMRLEIYHHFDLDDLGRMLRPFQRSLEKIMATIDDLVAAATEEDTKIDSLIALTTELKAKVDAALSGTNLPPAVQAKIDAAFAAVSDNPARIQAAIDANTDDEAPSETFPPEPVE